MKVSKIDLYPVKNGKALKARAHVTLVSADGAEMCVKGFRVHEKDDGKCWVGPPSEKYMKNGKAEYSETVWLSQSAQNLIYSAVVEKFKSEKFQKQISV